MAHEGRGVEIELAPEARWQPAASRRALEALLALDERLSLTVANAREAMLAQLRLAWWRDRLGEAHQERPIGEPLLAALDSWAGNEEALIGLVDAWEEMLGADPLLPPAIEGLSNAMAAAFETFARIAGSDGAPVADAGRRWALAHIHATARVEPDRDHAVHAATYLQPPARLPRALRGVAVLDALAARSLARGEPLLAGRGAALTALRVGMFGR